MSSTHASRLVTAALTETEARDLLIAAGDYANELLDAARGYVEEFIATSLDPDAPPAWTKLDDAVCTTRSASGVLAAMERLSRGGA